MVGDGGMITSARIRAPQRGPGHGVAHLPARPRDQEALHPGHRRRVVLMAARPGQHRRRGRLRRHLRHPHPRPRRQPGRPRRGGRLQEPRLRRVRLQDQQRRPGPAPHLPPARQPRPRPRADLHARLLPVLAPAQAWAPLTYADEHPLQRDNPVASARRLPDADRKASARPPRPGSRCAASGTCSTTWPPSPARSSPSETTKSRRSPSPPQRSGRPSTSSASLSRSPWSRHQQTTQGREPPARQEVHLPRLA